MQDGRRGRILLADDNADLRDHVARLLRPHWEVTTVADGQAALELAARRAVRPGPDRRDDAAAGRLRADQGAAGGRADPRRADRGALRPGRRGGPVEGLAAGADDYLVKPFSARDLTARVRANLELGQIRRQIISRLRGLVDAAAAVNTVRTTAEVLDVAARHVQAMTSAGRVVVTAPGARAEVDGGAGGSAVPDAVLPLPDTSGAALGELSVWSGADGPPEPVLLTQLARLIGLRLGNARLYEAEHRIASTLQHSLLPQSLPRVPGAIVASRYLPGSTEAEVGGDWYDVIVAPNEQLFLVIGDVVGKGVQAAAGMGQLRNALRAYILEGFDCGEALTRLNRLVDNLGRLQFATVVCVRFDPRTRRLWYSSAGHPSPIVAAPGQLGTFLYNARWARRSARSATSPTRPARPARPRPPAAALHRRAGGGPPHRHRQGLMSWAPTSPSRPSTSTTCSTRCWPRRPGRPGATTSRCSPCRSPNPARSCCGCPPNRPGSACCGAASRTSSPRTRSPRTTSST